jgi:hypothetical protein
MKRRSERAINRTERPGDQEYERVDGESMRLSTSPNLPPKRKKRVLLIRRMKMGGRWFNE